MTQESSNNKGSGSGSGNPPSSYAPPLPSRKAKNRNTMGYPQTGEDIDIENVQVTQYNIRDLPVLAQKFQNILITYPKKNQILENEKKELLTQQHNASILNTKLEKKIEKELLRIEHDKRRSIKKRNDTDLEIQELKKNIRTVSDEASRYQSALGNATNVRWDDDNINNSVQMAKWITGIQNTLNDFANIKGKDVEINDEHEKNANLLLANYKCKTRLSSSGAGNVKTGKPVLSAALQRSVLTKLFDEIDKYLNENKNNKSNDDITTTDENSEQVTIDDPNLEANVANTLEHLVSLLDELINSRQGEDDTSRITPVKIRQQIYAILGTRGFCKPEHPFINHLIKAVLNLMLKYRRFKSEEKIQDSQTIAEELVLEIVHLYFRLNAQVPIPDFRLFFEYGVQIQPTYMEGSWDDSGISELEVEICSFPLIYVNNKENKKVLCKAQVLTRRK